VFSFYDEIKLHWPQTLRSIVILSAKMKESSSCGKLLLEERYVLYLIKNGNPKPEI